MTTIHVQLDDATYERIRRKAEAAGLSPDQYLANWARAAADAAAEPHGRESGTNTVLGAFADDADLIDEVTQDIMRSREQAWRLP